MNQNRNRCLHRVIAAVLGASVVAIPSVASAADESMLEEITVTARKREETLQDISAAVSVVAGDVLRERVVTDVRDLQNLIPSLNVGEAIGIMKLNMRGLSNSTVVRGEDSEVVLHVDGAVISRAEAQGSAFFDLDRIEVLRGPQGTLYGRNSTGGTVNLITAKPTEELSGYVNATVGNYELKKFEGAIAGPISDRVLGRIALMAVDRNGYAKNLASGKDFLDEQRWATRAHLQFNMTEDVKFLLTGEYTKQDDRSGHLTFLDTVFGTPHTVIPPTSFSDPNSRDGAFSREPKMERETWSVTGTLDWRFTDALSLRSITNYRKLDFFNGSDLDVSASSFVDVDLPMKDKQFSQELQFIYDTEKLHALLGVYYYKEKMSGTTDVFLRFANSTLFQFVGENNTEALSPFWNATYDFNDRFSLRAGGRLNNEDRDFENFRFLGGNPTGQLADQRDFEKYTGEYGVDFRMTPDAMLYYTFSQGFRSGATLIMQIDSLIIDPTTVDNHEVGLKFQTPDRRFTANIAAYKAKVKNLQRSQATAILDANGNAIGAALRVNNINDMDVKGFEVELGWVPVERMRLGATIVHVDAEFKDFVTDDPFIPGNAFVQVAGNTPALSPKWRTNVHAEYGFLLGNGATVTPGVDWNYVSKQYFDEFNRDTFGEGSYSLLDASIAYRAPDDKWHVTLWGKNLTGEKRLYDANFSVFGQIKNKMMISPMTWGATFGYRF